MKLLITGANGQLGTELQKQAKVLGLQVLAVDQVELDIIDEHAVNVMVSDYSPDVVINAAAYTAVDKAESDTSVAFAVNSDGPKNLAKSCDKIGVPLVHYSTDYVFDGSKQGAYAEDTPVAPLGVYGASKLAGEQAVQQNCSKYLIFRTSWVFSSHGNNFVKTMLRLGQEREELGVVDDQYGKPTSAAELARITLEILPNLNEYKGLYHLAQPEVISWHGFAEAIFKEARQLGYALKIENLNAIGTNDYPTPAKRPVNSELNCDEIERVFNVTIKPWKESLLEVVKELKNV